MRLSLLRSRSLKIQRRIPEAAALALRWISRPEAKERRAAKNARHRGPQVVRQAERETIVVIEGEEAEPKIGAADFRSKKTIRIDREDKK